MDGGATVAKVLDDVVSADEACRMKADLVTIATSFAEGERSSLSEQTYQRLRSMILEGELKPGEIITERRLAQAIDISRTPLRAAINRLNGEGLVERLSNGSVVIRQVSIDEFLDILHIRRLLEGDAAREAAQHMDRAILDCLAVRNEPFRIGLSADFDAFWRLDDSFHDAIADACARPLMGGMIKSLRRQARMCNLSRMPATFQDQASEHTAVLAAIAAGDCARAEAAMHHHVDETRRRLIAWIT